MEIDADIEKLKIDLAKQIDDTKVNQATDKWKSAFVAIYVGVVSAVTTVCIGIVSFLPKIAGVFGVVSLLTSASLTVVAAWDGIFHHKKLWINTAKTLNELNELDADIRHTQASSNGLNQAQANVFYVRYKTIMRDCSERWYKIRE